MDVKDLQFISSGNKAVVPMSYDFKNIKDHCAA